MAKICNQLFIKDTHRNKQYTATAKCVCCGEESNFTEPFPFLLTNYTKWLKNFTKIHKDKGCNKTRLDAPDWAAKEVSFGIAV
jgi:rRNA maturation protein Nop10